METHLYDWLNLIIRWLHFTVGVAWIGASFYFVWLENHLDRINKAANVAGELWAVHGGGFYFVTKYKNGPEKMPERLHWFKYEAYFTWLSGFLLLAVVYYANAKLYMVGGSRWQLDEVAAIAVGLGTLMGGWLVYDLLCKSALVRRNYVFAAVLYLLVVGLSYLLTLALNPRGAYMHVGALLGTCMAANVFFVIIPSQKRMVRSYETGEPIDSKLALAAHQRSRHNNYLTLPVLFVMISNHFPMTFGHERSWLVLALIVLLGVMVRHWFNLQGQGRVNGFLLPASAFILLVVILYTAPVSSKVAAMQEKVPFATVEKIIDRRCVSCHSAEPSDEIFTVAPAGVKFDTPQEIVSWAERIKQRSVTLRSMPFANKTNMTEDERKLVGAWIDQGAKLP